MRNNVLSIAAVAELELQNFKFAQMNNKEHKVETRTEAAIDGNTMLADGWFLHPKTVPEKIDEKYKVRLQDGTETEDYFTGFNWYWYDYTEIVAWKPTCI